MITLDSQKIAQLRRGEIVSMVATVLCGVALAYFVICFSIAEAYDIYALKISTLIAAPILMVLFAAVAAYCNLKYGKKLDAMISNYVKEVFIENAAAMHPERNSLTFYCTVRDSSADIKVNDFKERIVFDFSAFKKLSLSKKSVVGSAISDRLCTTFCRLVTERKTSYTSVSYLACSPKKGGKEIFIIKNGEPDKKALKYYYKHRKRA